MRYTCEFLPLHFTQSPQPQYSCILCQVVLMLSFPHLVGVGVGGGLERVNDLVVHLHVAWSASTQMINPFWIQKWLFCELIHV